MRISISIARIPGVPMPAPEIDQAIVEERDQRKQRRQDEPGEPKRQDEQADPEQGGEGPDDDQVDQQGEVLRRRTPASAREAKMGWA